MSEPVNHWCKGHGTITGLICEECYEDACQENNALRKRIEDLEEERDAFAARVRELHHDLEDMTNKHEIVSESYSELMDDIGDFIKRTDEASKAHAKEIKHKDTVISGLYRRLEVLED